MNKNNIKLLKLINGTKDLSKRKANTDNITKYFDSLKLAYIGDSIYENFIRDYVLNKYKNTLKMNDIHKKVTSLVCASMQANIIDNMLTDDFLNEKEIEIFKNARNHHNMTKSKSSSIVDYRKATGFEAVIGYLYFENSFDRLKECFSYIERIIQ